jgi:hypothetical protein
VGRALGKLFFFEKKNQKTLATGLGVASASEPNSQKSFASFLQKRRLVLRGRDAPTGMAETAPCSAEIATNHELRPAAQMW